MNAFLWILKLLLAAIVGYALFLCICALFVNPKKEYEKERHSVSPFRMRAETERSGPRRAELLRPQRARGRFAACGFSDGSGARRSPTAIPTVSRSYRALTPVPADSR